MMFVTHDLELAAAVCDRIAVMYAGFLVEDRRADSLHEEARHPYTAGLLASRPSPTQRAARLWAIPGRPLSAFEVEDGCAFASRCPFVEQRCRVERRRCASSTAGACAASRPRSCAADSPKATSASSMSTSPRRGSRITGTTCSVQ